MSAAQWAEGNCITRFPGEPSAWRRTENLGGVFGSNQVSLYYYSQSSLSLFLLGPNQPLFDNSLDNSFLALLSDELSIQGICSSATLSLCHCATSSLKAKKGSNPGQFNRTILFHVFLVEGRRTLWKPKLNVKRYFKVRICKLIAILFVRPFRISGIFLLKRHPPPFLSVPFPNKKIYQSDFPPSPSILWYEWLSVVVSNRGSVLRLFKFSMTHSATLVPDSLRLTLLRLNNK